MFHEPLRTVCKRLRRGFHIMPEGTGRQLRILQLPHSLKRKDKDRTMISTLEICRKFYEEYGADMIRRTAPEYESRIAVGLAGEGSECFGFDDEISRDHDFGVGFCMWMDRETYQAIGQKLDLAYHSLLKEKGTDFNRSYFGDTVSDYQPRSDGRRGVLEIASWLGNVLHMQPDLDRIIGKRFWTCAEERFLATAVNGQVWRDDQGMFTRIRKEIESYYPDPVYYLKLAEQLHLFSHAGQSNYPRVMARGDLVTAALCVRQTMEAAMKICYLLNRTYAPYYKWTYKGMEKLDKGKEICLILEKLAVLPVQTDAWKDVSYSSIQINERDQAIRLIEQMAGIIADELTGRGLVSGRQVFLESYVPELAAKAERSVSETNYGSAMSDKNRKTKL